MEVIGGAINGTRKMGRFKEDSTLYFQMDDHLIPGSVNHHPVLSKTLFLFGYLKHLTRLRIFNFFITPLHLKFALPDISSSIIWKDQAILCQLVGIDKIKGCSAETIKPKVEILT